MVRRGADQRPGIARGRFRLLGLRQTRIWRERTCTTRSLTILVDRRRPGSCAHHRRRPAIVSAATTCGCFFTIDLAYIFSPARQLSCGSVVRPLEQGDGGSPGRTLGNCTRWVRMENGVEAVVVKPERQPASPHHLFGHCRRCLCSPPTNQHMPCVKTWNASAVGNREFCGQWARAQAAPWGTEAA